MIDEAQLPSPSFPNEGVMSSCFQQDIKTTSPINYNQLGVSINERIEKENRHHANVSSIDMLRYNILHLTIF